MDDRIDINLVSVRKERLPKYTIEVQGWEELHIVAPIAEYIHLYVLCRDKEGDVDDIDILCALEAASHAMWMLMSNVSVSLKRADEFSDHIIESEDWHYTLGHMVAIVDMLKERGFVLPSEDDTD